MENVLTPGGRALKHEAVREYVRDLVAGRHPGAPAPSERELVSRFGVARMTVRQALDALVAEGLLERVPGRGTFVAPPRRTATPVLSFREEMTARGMVPESQTLALRLEQAGAGVARALSISEGDAVVHWRRLRHADGAAMSVEDVYLNEVLLPGFLQGPVPSSLYDELAGRGLRPTWVEDAIGAGLASDDEARLLGLPVGTAVLRKQRRGLWQEKVIEVSRSVCRADRYMVRVNLGGSD
ncbi:GntR family transcriptional regulator [Nocardioides terrae]|uniref:GntR family transcriptional regulator n=1 Tax=Nocardioides terrae TaxID=574651 RepID=UPI001FDFF78B|nr:GntR family transcriptional regulator [Nocardioides terrae]